MASLSKVRETSTTIATASSGSLPYPDPRAWPKGVRDWFCAVRGNCVPLDIFIFNHGNSAAMYLQDAITAQCILNVEPSEWQIDQGYPAFVFHPAKIDAIRRFLEKVGYSVKVMVPACQPAALKARAKTGLQRVVSISSARNSNSEPKEQPL